MGRNSMYNKAGEGTSTKMVANVCKEFVSSRDKKKMFK